MEKFRLTLSLGSFHFHLIFFNSHLIVGKFKGEDVLIQRILIPTEVPFQFKHAQFPISLAFTMTINKLQYQWLEMYGINLELPCFSYGYGVLEGRLTVGAIRFSLRTERQK